MQAQQFWTQTYKKNIGKLIGVCYRYVGDRSVAEDLAHEAFLKAIEKSDQYHNFGRFEAWLMRINLNTTLDYLRKQPYFQSVEEVEICDDGTETEEEALPAADFTEQEILEAVCSLPEKQRTVFNLYVFEKQKHTQIAETLQIGVRSSKRYLSEARAQLQARLTNIHKRKKSLLMVLVPFIPHKAHAIDRLCRTKLQHLSVAPVQSSPLAGVNWGVAPKPSAWMALSAAKVPAIATATTGIAIATVSGTLIVLQPAVPTEQQNPLSTNEMRDTIGMVMDTAALVVDTVPDVVDVETMCTSSLHQPLQTHPTTKPAPVPPLSETETHCPCQGTADSARNQSAPDIINRDNYTVVYENARVASKRALEPFTSLTVSSHIDVIIARGDESTAYIAADSNVIDYVRTEVVDVIDRESFEVVGRDLIVSLKPRAPKTDSPISVTIYTPHLKEVTLQGLGNVTAREIVEDSFTVTNQGTGSFKCTCLVAKKELVLQNSNAGCIDVSYLCHGTVTITNKSEGWIRANVFNGSKTKQMNIQNMGVGDISLEGLIVSLLKIKNSGAGKISLQGTAEDLTSENDGVGNIYADKLTAYIASIRNKGMGTTKVHCTGAVHLWDKNDLDKIKTTGGANVHVWD
ncbi:MAG: sigma-70 family RNA polymerase sigma factor [Bacteroidales bacterium]|nr:sigma-70 family RNA polymerase sigma factor [Bacteroidales bacterium]